MLLLPKGLSKSSKDVVFIDGLVSKKEEGGGVAYLGVDEVDAEVRGVDAWMGVSHGELDALLFCIRCCSTRESFDVSTGLGVVFKRSAKASLGFWGIGADGFTEDDDGEDQLRSNKSSILF